MMVADLSAAGLAGAALGAAARCWPSAWSSGTASHATAVAMTTLGWGTRKFFIVLPLAKLDAALIDDQRLGVLVLFSLNVIATVPLEHAEVSVDESIERHAHLPRAGEHLRIVDRHFVLDVIAIDRRVALDDVKIGAVEIAGVIEPGALIELSHVNDERVAFPVAARIAHPEVGPPLEVIARAPLDADDPQRTRKCVTDSDFVGVLDDLERVRHVGGTRDTQIGRA